MALSIYLVTYKTDTNPHHLGNPLAFDRREKAVVSISEDRAVAYVATGLDLAGVEHHDIAAKLHKPYTP